MARKLLSEFPTKAWLYSTRRVCPVSAQRISKLGSFLICFRNTVPHCSYFRSVFIPCQNIVSVRSSLSNTNERHNDSSGSYGTFRWVYFMKYIKSKKKIVTSKTPKSFSKSFISNILLSIYSYASNIILFYESYETFNEFLHKCAIILFLAQL